MLAFLCVEPNTQGCDLVSESSVLECTAHSGVLEGGVWGVDGWPEHVCRQELRLTHTCRKTITSGQGSALLSAHLTNEKGHSDRVVALGAGVFPAPQCVQQEEPVTDVEFGFGRRVLKQVTGPFQCRNAGLSLCDVSGLRGAQVALDHVLVTRHVW